MNPQPDRTTAHDQVLELASGDTIEIETTEDHIHLTLAPRFGEPATVILSSTEAMGTGATIMGRGFGKAGPPTGTRTPPPAEQILLIIAVLLVAGGLVWPQSLLAIPAVGTTITALTLQHRRRRTR